MANKMTEYQRGRDDGFRLALRILDEGGIEALKKEAHVRGVFNLQSSMTGKEIGAQFNSIYTTCMEAVKIMTLSVLHDCFGFGKGRLDRFLTGCNKFEQYLEHGWLYWMDVITDIKEEYGYDLVITDHERACYGQYRRPEHMDVWEEADLISQDDFREVIDDIGYTEMDETDQNGKKCKAVYDENNKPIWRYYDKYGQLSLYDFLLGVRWEKYNKDAETAQ